MKQQRGRAASPPPPPAPPPPPQPPPQPQPQPHPNQHVFYVEGNIASGKTSFLRAMASAYPDSVQVIYEPVHKWEATRDTAGKSILDYFYTDMARNSYLFQSAVFLSRIRALEAVDPAKRIVFVERSVDCDRRVFASNCVAAGTMNEIEWAVYADWHKWLCEALRRSGGLPCSRSATYLYLRTPPEVAHARMLRRDRTSESDGGVTVDYLRQLHARHEAWLGDGGGGGDDGDDEDDGACAEHTLVFDGTCDFIHDADARQSMFERCQRHSLSKWRCD